MTTSRPGVRLPDLDLSPSIPCTDDMCKGDCDTDGTSWWCNRCGATWDDDGTKGSRSDEWLPSALVPRRTDI